MSQRGPHFSRRAAGFTLIELLVVIAVLSVVTGIGVRAFVAVSGGWRTQEIRIGLAANADKALAGIQEALAQSVSARLGGTAISGEQRTEEGRRYGRVALEDDRLTVPMQVSVPSGVQERRNATFSIDRSSGIPRLIRSEATHGAQAGDALAFEVASGVMALRLEYFDGTQWHRAWSGAAHPRAVRASVVVQDESRPYEQLARTITVPIRVD